MFWPFMVFGLSHKTLLRTCIAGMALSLGLRIAVVASGAWLQVAYLITPCRFDGLLAGAFIALAMRDEQLWAKVHKWAPTAMLTSASLIVGITVAAGHFACFVDFRKMQGPRMDSSLALTIGISALSVFFGGLLALLLVLRPRNRFRLFLENRVLVTIGKVSYGMYVFHVLVLWLSVHAINRYMPQITEWHPWATKTLLLVVAVTVSFAIALVSYHLFEKRFLRLKKRFEYTEQPSEESSSQTLDGPMKQAFSTHSRFPYGVS